MACSPNNSSDVQRRCDQGQGSLTLTMTMSPAWGSAGDRAAGGQPGHQSAIGVWSPVNSASVFSLSLYFNSFSHFTESLLTHKSLLTLFSSPTRVITITFMILLSFFVCFFLRIFDRSSYSTRMKGWCYMKRRKTQISQIVCCMASEVTWTCHLDLRIDVDVDYLGLGRLHNIHRLTLNL